MMILSQVFVVAALLPKCLFKEEVWKVWPKKRVVEIIVSTRKELASNAGHNANFGLGWRPAESRKKKRKNGSGPFSTVKVCAIM